MGSSNHSYDHTQRGLLHWLLLGFAGLVVVMSFATHEPGAAVIWGLRASALLFAGLAACFVRLRIRHAGDGLDVAFGPARLFRRSVRYDAVAEVVVGRSALIDGWGIHCLPGRGWTWNIHGFEAVELTLRDGSRLRLGTDDSAHLADFIRSRITAPPLP